MPPPAAPAPLSVEPSASRTQIPMSTYVTTGSVDVLAIVFTFVRWLAHSGQRMPTGVGVMQSGHIGRPHEEHATPVSRPGWR
jgi:hypothetical protein